MTELNRYRELAGLKALTEEKLTEATVKKYMAYGNSGDGPELQVFDDPKKAWEHVEREDYAQIFSFTGEFISFGMQGYEMALQTTGEVESIFSQQHGEIEHDKLNLADEDEGETYDDD